jgi:cell wall-associated NlpC family hydrolase
VNGKALLATGTNRPSATHSVGPHVVKAGKRLTPGTILRSPNGRYRLIMQGDGNLVVYQGSKAKWSTGTSGHPGASAVMQGDGNLVVYRSGKPLWQSDTDHHPGAVLDMQDDGNLVIYWNGKALWASKQARVTQSGMAIVRAAASQAGRPYCFAGGNQHGPTHGWGNSYGASHCGGGSIVGFDCTGLTQYAAYQGTKGAVNLSHHDSKQAKYAPGKWVKSQAALQPGDIVYFGYSRESISHAAIYAGVVGGRQMIWDADTAFWTYPDGVHMRTLASENSLHFVGAARVWAGG